MDKALRFRDNLKTIMKDKKITGTELAKLIGVSQAAVSKIMSGKIEDPSMTVVSKIADVLGVTVENLMYSDDTSNLAKTYLPKSAHTVPMLNWVQAGQFTDIDPRVVKDWYLCPDSIGHNGFCLTVRGDSMEPDFHEGDIVFVDPDRAWHSGSIVIVVDDGQSESFATMKKLVQDETGHSHLKPLNPAWPQQFIPFTENMRVVGTVIGKYRGV